jgi:hypothetical protein
MKFLGLLQMQVVQRFLLVVLHMMLLLVQVLILFMVVPIVALQTMTRLQTLMITLVNMQQVLTLVCIF